jgi:hypothetical protein
VRPSPIPWLAADVREIVVETPRVKTIRLSVPGWPGHLPGQHVDVRLTAEDGYQAQRSYSIASSPEEDGIALTVERLEDGEVSTFLADELRVGDRLELRGPLGGWFTWTVARAVPRARRRRQRIVPLMAMIRHRARGEPVPTASSARGARRTTDLPRRLRTPRGPTRRPRGDAHRDPQCPCGLAGHTRRIDREMLVEVLPPRGPAARVRLRADAHGRVRRHAARLARPRPRTDPHRALRAHRR